MLLSSCINHILKYCGVSHNSNKLVCSKLLRCLVNEKKHNGIPVHTTFSTELYSQISTMPVLCAKAVHTVKGWKYIARDGEKHFKSHDASSAACEEGNEAVSHAVVVSSLENCSSVASQLDAFSSLMTIPPEDIENRKAFCRSLDEAFRIYFPSFKTNLFGSSINGLGFRGCDLDVCFQTNFSNEDYLLQKEVPTLKSVVDGTVSRETVSRLNPLYMLRFVRRILREHYPDIQEPILLIKARCPLLRFYCAKYKVFCDFSCENRTSLQNTKLFRFICNLDERFSTLAKVIRYWGKYGGFVGDIEMFNSYAFSLLVIHFLQVTNPPVLPSVNEIFDKSEYIRSGSVDDDDLLFKDLQNFSPSKNTMTVEELLKKFYFYYLNFDFSRMVMQPFTSTAVPLSSFVPNKDLEDIFELGSVIIQDPFRHSFNATAGASYKTCKRFLNGLVKACEVYQDGSLWIPKTEMWGLCSLFQPPMSEQKINEKREQNHSHIIKLPAQTEAALKLWRIFEYGLLFHCRDFCSIQKSDHGTDSKPILKVHCKVHNNTLQGRDWILQNFKNNNDKLPLDLEHFISKQLLNNRTETRRQILCEFHCECWEIKENNEPMLMLTLKFNESKFSSVVAIFLKEYVPCIFKKL